MRPEDEDRIAAQLARVMAVACVRNTQLEALHAGRTPISRTGDGSDVIVQDAEGNRIPWSEVSRIDDDEMRALMREIVDRLYTFHLRIDDPAFRAEIDRWASMAAKWDAAKPDPVLSAIPGKTPEHG
ncbi:hypothetical protein [Gemmobacter nectariphilus]|uniref:hypothetical protein n=1 Tax=Gemmobacter nectariphilus TaxID=220343 RepID=UPI00054DD80D|nr:hypothetical protein [Gemmobacter nectariphilus]